MLRGSSPGLQVLAGCLALHWAHEDGLPWRPDLPADPGQAHPVSAQAELLPLLASARSAGHSWSECEPHNLQRAREVTSSGLETRMLTMLCQLACIAFPIKQRTTLSSRVRSPQAAASLLCKRCVLHLPVHDL